MGQSQHRPTGSDGHATHITSTGELGKHCYKESNTPHLISRNSPVRETTGINKACPDWCLPGVRAHLYGLHNGPLPLFRKGLHPLCALKPVLEMWVLILTLLEWAAHLHSVFFRAFLVTQTVKKLPAVQEAQVRSLGREDPPGEGNGYPLQDSCLENPMGRGAWWATVVGSQRVGHNWLCVKVSCQTLSFSLWEVVRCGLHAPCLIKHSSINYHHHHHHSLYDYHSNERSTKKLRDWPKVTQVVNYRISLPDLTIS